MTTQPPHDGADRPNRVPWPPILDAVTIIAAVVLQRVWPLSPLVEPGVWRWPGWLLAAAGVAVALAGVIHFQRVGTAIDPTGRASRVATGGIYGWTRNPMYTGTLLALIGVGIGWPSTWLLILVPLLAFGLYELAIAREEAYLERRFGDEYLAYKARVRRWL